MSGPKIDYAELERQEKERQKKEYLERLRRIKEETDKYYAAMLVIKKQKNDMHNYGNDIIVQSKVYDGSEHSIRTIADKKSECENKILSLLKISLPSSPEEIATHTERIKRETDAIIHEFQTLTNKELDELKSLILTKEQIDKADVFFSSINSDDEQILISDPAVFGIIVDRKLESVDMKEECKTVFNGISNLLACDTLTREERIIALKSLNGLCNLLLETSNDIIKAKFVQYRRTFAELSNNSKETEELYYEYVAAYVAYSDISSEDIPMKSIVDFKNIEEINEETNRLNNLAIRIKNEDYIREQISEVMKMFGYDNCVDLNFKNKSGTDFEFLNTDSSLGIHVYISDSTNGSQQQIMMEITDYQYSENCDSPQIDIDNLSEEEISEILDKQGQFCEMHPEIVAELRKRGVILSEKKHHPISREHSKRIIHYERPEKMQKDKLLYREVVKKKKRQYMNKK